MHCLLEWFGTVFYLTKRIYPLIIIHSLIDFSAGKDRIGITSNQHNPDSFINSMLIILLLSPYFIYALYLFKQLKTQTP